MFLLYILHLSYTYILNYSLRLHMDIDNLAKS